MHRWMTKGHPSAFWLSGLFFPHGFVTGVLQAHARKHKKAIDFLKFRFRFLPRSSNGAAPDGESSDPAVCLGIRSPPADGVYVYGAFLEGADWDWKTMCIREQRRGQMICELPVMHLLPFEVLHKVHKAFTAKEQNETPLTQE